MCCLSSLSLGSFFVRWDGRCDVRGRPLAQAEAARAPARGSARVHTARDDVHAPAKEVGAEADPAAADTHQQHATDQAHEHLLVVVDLRARAVGHSRRARTREREGRTWKQPCFTLATRGAWPSPSTSRSTSATAPSITSSCAHVCELRERASHTTLSPQRERRACSHCEPTRWKGNVPAIHGAAREPTVTRYARGRTRAELVRGRAPEGVCGAVSG